MRKEILLPLLAAILVFAISLISGLAFSRQHDDPGYCSSCHEMQPYYDSFLDPKNGSVIESHKLNCVQCHVNKSIADTKTRIAAEIIAYRFNISGSLIPKLSIKPDCSICHPSPTSSIHGIVNITDCTLCHWGHTPVEGKLNISGLPQVPYGAHSNQTCFNCHGTEFKIPQCINCHAGHGEQKLENRLCLGCHIDPHVPKIPGLYPYYKVKFNISYPFSVCQPCHQDEYFNLTNTRSLHTSMDTCTQCHDTHGRIPKCSQCHPGMNLPRHSDFKCDDCHISLNPIRIKCEDCHGRSHEWSARTAIINPK